MPAPITVQVTVNAPIETVWKCWNEPAHIRQWAFASDDWESPAAENDPRTGGAMKVTMAAKDGSASFDMIGKYTDVRDRELLEYDMSDGRHVRVEFKDHGDTVDIVETFDPEQYNSEDKQQEGWQAILDNFKRHVESHG